MVPPSAPSHRGSVPWKGLLLAVSLITFWTPPTTTQLTVKSVPANRTAPLTVESAPANAAEGEDVLLLVHNRPENTIGFSWFKGESVESAHQIAGYEIATQQTTTGPAHSGRETLYTNGSLLFQNVRKNDTGFYTLHVIKSGLQIETVIGQFHVFEDLSKVNFTITSNNSSPVEHSDTVVLTCDSKIQDTTYLWFINNHSLPGSARLELSKDNRTLTLFHVTRNDTGPYECEVQNLVSAHRSDPLTLNVLYGPDAPTISPPDSYYLEGAALNLSCQAASNPPAQYFWFFNGELQQSTQMFFIASLAMNNSGNYTCLANNSDTGLNNHTVKTIQALEPVTKPSIQTYNITVTENDVVNLTCLTNDIGVSILWFFNQLSLPLTERMKLSQGNSTLTIKPIRREDTGDYHCMVTNPVSFNKSDTLKLVVKYNPELHSGLSAGAIAGIVIGVLAGVALIAALVYFLYLRKTGGASDHHQLSEQKPSASNNSQDHSDNPPNKDREMERGAEDREGKRKIDTCRPASPPMK
ncbi:carcinoembryonic antigen-related cell adhesion molecule 1 isoform X3 [Erinaceus europaeus]|uniref:Carcinoembryonic antigen-related cell adhesion molecule 1 isoform X3 n=1 Tax=Erinaceus europaeus TaxID=9365 RepID=A0ABM3WZJ9_ERIEU|nr:carcinoembryonic antigen-related cell adhesion molecule 1 isoform X3 [Erinaceus europaeus]XP_060041998.1 carcinoembryonic antigen-related cell adhesion molecule 1 isoform X3 [Erinaceus europaeus]XP_060042000.1 carcinoembryonic antigen-related cell adhesion molecule 1 isoform X3 [Erinaceus europaeus]